jgi:hypothetical protein
MSRKEQQIFFWNCEDGILYEEDVSFPDEIPLLSDEFF